ncbi:MAG: ABC transporter permease [Deinococcus sp.]|nr:ABC transporter permease [Deinococcus sp.]
MRNLRGIYVIWLRDVKRFWQDRVRVVVGIAQPALYLFVLGNGLGGSFSLAGTPAAQGGFVRFMYPGIIGMTVLFTATFSAISIVWDREFGFLKEVLVAPVSRSAIAIGKALGGATQATLQGAIILLLAPLAGVQITLLDVLILLPVMALVAFAMTSLGIAIAARMRSMESFQVVMNFFLMPMFFLSGAMFFTDRVPAWMKPLVSIDPLTYGVDALRGIVLGLNRFPLVQSVLILAGFATLALGLAVRSFQREG